MPAPENEYDANARRSAGRDRPSHPFWKANLLMLGVLVGLLLVSVLSVVGGR